MNALHSALQSLKDKHKAFIGNRKDQITSANAEGFKQGLDWAIGTIESAIEQEQFEEQYNKEQEESISLENRYKYDEEVVIGEPLENYIRGKHNQDRCTGFIDGYETAIKNYSEEDLRKAYNTNHYSQEEKEKHWESFKQSLNHKNKQPINKVIKTWVRTIETPDYILAVSDGVKAGDYVVTYPDKDIVQVNQSTYVLYDEKIIAYQPKNNAPELDLPLLPELVMEDDVKKLSIEYAGKQRYWSQGVSNAFIAGYKVATKVYSEEDLRKAFNAGTHWKEKWKTVTDDNINIPDVNKFIQSLKQPKTPKLFVAEIKQSFQQDKSKRSDPKNGVYYKLKTTTINGKEYLVGTFLYE